MRPLLVFAALLAIVPLSADGSRIVIDRVTPDGAAGTLIGKQYSEVGDVRIAGVTTRIHNVSPQALLTEIRRISSPTGAARARP